MLTTLEQPCYVPFASRIDESPACLYIVNTPDTNTGASTTEADVVTACRKREIPGLLSVARCNNNIYTATFDSPSAALMARSSIGISLPCAAPGCGSVTISAGFHFTWAPRVFSCDVGALDLDHDAVSKCITRALRGRDETAFYELLQQETSEPYDDRMRYLIRFKKGTRAPWCSNFTYRSKSITVAAKYGQFFGRRICRLSVSFVVPRVSWGAAALVISPGSWQYMVEDSEHLDISLTVPVCLCLCQCPCTAWSQSFLRYQEFICSRSDPDKAWPQDCAAHPNVLTDRTASIAVKSGACRRF